MAATATCRAWKPSHDSNTHELGAGSLLCEQGNPLIGDHVHSYICIPTGSFGGLFFYKLNPFLFLIHVFVSVCVPLLSSLLLFKFVVSWLSRLVVDRCPVIYFLLARMVVSISRLPNALVALLYLQSLYTPCWAQKSSNGTAKIPNFGDPVPVFGAVRSPPSFILHFSTNIPKMDPSIITFRDGFKLDMLSPTNRTVIVRQNTTPLDAQFITGTNGGSAETFVPLSNNSYIVTMNEPANDLIANIAMPYNIDDIRAKGVQASNTYVATLAADKRSWIVDEATRNIQRDANQTRCVKLTSVGGEYLLVGRVSSEMGNTFVKYGTGPENTVSLNGGVGVQEAEYMDGFRVSVQTNQTVNMTASLNQGINPGTLNAGFECLNSFSWIVKTSNATQNVDGTMFFPCKISLICPLPLPTNLHTI